MARREHGGICDFKRLSELSIIAAVRYAAPAWKIGAR